MLYKTSIKLNDQVISTTNEIKVLGVNIDSKITFNTYVKNICSRASYQINALRRIGKYLDINGKLKIYKSFISANFSYNPVTWIFCGRANSDKMEKLQERALRYVYRDNVSSYQKLLSNADLLPLSLLRLRFLAIEMYKCVYKLNPQYMSDLFHERRLRYNLRNSNLLTQHRFTTKKYGFRSFIYYGAKLWNALPVDLKQIDQLHIFKQRLTEWCATNDALRLEIF